MDDSTTLQTGFLADDLGGPDLLVNNAGVIESEEVPIWEADPHEWWAVAETDLRGPFNLIRAVVPGMVERGRGRVIDVSSGAGATDREIYSAYCAAKAGVTGLVRALAVELGGTGVTANAVSPGSTDTPILTESARLYGLASAAAFARQQPVDRLLDPAEVAAALVWLAGERSSGVTGAVLPVDGGLAL